MTIARYYRENNATYDGLNFSHFLSTHSLVKVMEVFQADLLVRGKFGFLFNVIQCAEALKQMYIKTMKKIPKKIP